MHVRPVLVVLAVVTFAVFGLLGVYRYVDNYWVYRGFAPPHDPAYVKVRGTSGVSSSQPGTRRSPPARRSLSPAGIRVTHPSRHYPVMYLLHGAPGRPDAFLDTVRMGVVEDELVALHRARPMILVMPFGSTGTFTDTEWANGVGRNHAWETFLARDVVRAVDSRYRTIRAVRAGRPASPKAGTGRSTSPSITPASSTVESWSGYMRADDIGAIFEHRPALCARTLHSCHLVPAAASLRPPARTSGSTAARRIRSVFRMRASPVSSRLSRSRTGSSSSVAVTTGRSGAATPPGPTLPHRGTFIVVSVPFAVILALAGVAATGWLYLSGPGAFPARGSQRCFRLTNSRDTPTAPAALVRSVWVGGRPPAVALACAGRRSNG